MDTNFDTNMDANASLVTPIYERHVAALRMVSGNGVWIDEGAARLSLWLALTELAGNRSMVGIQPPAHDGWSPTDALRLDDWLKEHFPAHYRDLNPINYTLGDALLKVLGFLSEEGIDLRRELELQKRAHEHETNTLMKTIAELERPCSTNPSPSTPTTVATAPSAPAVPATSSAAAPTPLPPAGRSSTDDPAPVTTASIASSTTPAAVRLPAIQAELMATPTSPAKRYPMTTEQMKAAVVECIRQHTIDGIAPSSTWISANTDTPLQALLKRTNCKYSDLVAEAGAQPAPIGRRKAVTPVEPFRAI